MRSFLHQLNDEHPGATRLYALDRIGLDWTVRCFRHEAMPPVSEVEFGFVRAHDWHDPPGAGCPRGDATNFTRAEPLAFEFQTIKIGIAEAFHKISILASSISRRTLNAKPSISPSGVVNSRFAGETPVLVMGPIFFQGNGCPNESFPVW